MNWSFLLGLGFDADDGHKRISKGKNFYVLGGSKPTHEMMREQCIKFNEELDKRHKTLDEIHQKEFHEIAEKIGLKKLEEERKRKEKE